LLVREQASLPRGKLLTGKGGSMDESGLPGYRDPCSGSAE